MALFTEIRRRNVLKVALLYVLASLLLIWLVGGTLISMGAPQWANEFVLLVLAIGFPVALIFAWSYEITPSGLKKSLDVDQTQSIVFKTGQKLNAAVSVLVVLGVLALVGQQLLPTFEFPKIIEPILLAPVYESPDRENVPEDIRAHTLDNGLRIVVWPDDEKTGVVMYNAVRAGGRDEHPGRTGLAHLFEHLISGGTDRQEQGEVAASLAAVGGANNAYASKDLTVYQSWFPRSALEAVFELEGNRLARFAIDQDALESQRAAVNFERVARYDNDNFARLYQEMAAVAFVAHPYRLPLFGWTSDIENWTQEDLEDFYRIYYAPNNLTMVFAGDVVPEEIFTLAESHFGDLPAQDPPPAIRTVEPEQLGERRLLVEVDSSTTLLHMSFHAGSATDPSTLAMKVLLNILVGDESSRLHRLFVEEEQIALAVGGFQMAGFDPGLVYFHLTLPPNADIAAVEHRLLDELDTIAREGVTPAEIDSARSNMLANYSRDLATLDGMASALGNAEVFLGDYQNAFSLPDELAAIDAEQIQRAAASVFNSRNMTVGVLRSAVDAQAQ